MVYCAACIITPAEWFVLIIMAFSVPQHTYRLFLTCSQVGHWTSGDSRALHIRATYSPDYMALYCTNDRWSVQESSQFLGHWHSWWLRQHPAVESHPTGRCRKPPCTHRKNSAITHFRAAWEDVHDVHQLHRHDPQTASSPVLQEGWPDRNCGKAT